MITNYRSSISISYLTCMGALFNNSSPLSPLVIPHVYMPSVFIPLQLVKNHVGNDLYSDNWMQTIENPPKAKKLQTDEITTAVSTVPALPLL